MVSLDPLTCLQYPFLLEGMLNPRMRSNTASLGIQVGNCLCSVHCSVDTRCHSPKNTLDKDFVLNDFACRNGLAADHDKARP